MDTDSFSGSGVPLGYIRLADLIVGFVGMVLLVHGNEYFLHNSTNPSSPLFTLEVVASDLDTLFFAVVYAFVLGLFADQISSMLIRKRYYTNDGDLTEEFASRTEYPPTKAWNAAQRWIWSSAGARAEFGQLRFNLSLAKGVAFTFFCFGGFYIGIGIAQFGELVLPFGTNLLGDHAPWWQTLLAGGAGLFFAEGFRIVWEQQTGKYHRLVAKALEVGSPTD